MHQKLTKKVESKVKELYGIDLTIELTRPEEKFGDYSTNVALKLSGQLGKAPSEIAATLVAALEDEVNDDAEISTINPGFINFTLKDHALLDEIGKEISQPLKGKIVVVEYSDPNPFKVLHAGHLYTSVVGDAIANLLERSGATVNRVNFGGDVGMHVAKTLWAMLQELGDNLPTKYRELSVDQRADWMAKCYVQGSQQFDADDKAKLEITELNKKIYGLVESKELTTNLAQLYWMTREWSYEYFKKFYTLIGTNFDKYYAESEVQELGIKTVREQLDKGVYSLSEGAIVFKGEKFGLHTRVFINSEGLPTYETKDVGLIIRKYQDYHFDRSIIITANEQEQYMAVVQKSIEQFAPELVKSSTHLTHGIVKLAGGVKMSSRLGNFLRAVDVIDTAADANQKLTGKDNQDSVIGAVKYAFLKTRMGGDIIYDPKESVSIEGNSGPYLQYAYARAMSIISKGKKLTPDFSTEQVKLNEGERSLVRQLTEFAEVVEAASKELMPHLLCTYLYELAQSFNRFYEKNRVIGDQREDFRIFLVNNYATTLKHGLEILGVPAPEHI